MKSQVGRGEHDGGRVERTLHALWGRDPETVKAHRVCSGVSNDIVVGEGIIETRVQVRPVRAEKVGDVLKHVRPVRFGVEMDQDLVRVVWLDEVNARPGGLCQSQERC